MASVCVCGSRGWKDYESIYQELTKLPKDTLIMHGGAVGADNLADRAAEELGLERLQFPANWQRYGRQAGFLRNEEMLRFHPEKVLAFWDGKSPGTRHMIQAARDRGIFVVVFTQGGK